MGTPAGVYFADYDSAVRINYDGYPDHMIPALTYIVNSGNVENMISRVEFSSIYDSVDYYEKISNDPLYEKNKSRYIMDPIGESYPEDDRWDLDYSIEGDRLTCEDVDYFYYVKGSTVSALKGRSKNIFILPS